MAFVSGIVLAGGSGTRMGLGQNKVFLRLGGETVLARSIRALLPFVDELIVVHRAEDEAEIRAMLDALDTGCPVKCALGGDTRQASVRNGLAVLHADSDTVLIHDAARCLVDAETIARVLESIADCGSGVAAVPTVDTIKQVQADGASVAETLPRERLWSIQTPQGFRRDWIEQAHRQAEQDGWLGTDDASLLEHIGLPVRLVLGNRHNIKLTTREDIAMAEVFLNGDMPAVPPLRIGQGYDVHRFKEGRPLMLCGVDVPHTEGLDGHSDADVAVHALMDALLGALALGDIGQHFPDTDERYRGISSMKLLRHVMELLKAHGASLVNADVTIVAQAPKLMPYIPAMRQNLAEAMEVPLERVSVKATTTERLGFEGRKEGISAQAVVLLQLKV